MLAPTPPIRAMTRLLAEMQTSIMSAALPLFDGRVDRFMIYTLLVRRTLDGGLATPVLALADSLGLPFETTRRHVAGLVEAGLCARRRGGIVTIATLEDEPYASIGALAHDALVRFIEDMARIDALPAFPASPRPYHWHSGVRASVDLMLSVARANQQTHHDRLDLVIFSTVLAANDQRIVADPALARRFATPDAEPLPSQLRAPIRIPRVAQVLGLSDATVRRRVERLLEGPLIAGPGGLSINDVWLATEEARSASGESHANLRRLLGALAAQGFPFHDIASAYLRGRPPRPFGN